MEISGMHFSEWQFQCNIDCMGIPGVAYILTRLNTQKLDRISLRKARIWMEFPRGSYKLDWKFYGEDIMRWKFLRGGLEIQASSTGR